MKWLLRRRKCDIFAFNLIISFVTVKCWLITLNSASIFRRKMHSAWLTFMTTVSSAIMLSTVFTFHCVSIEVLTWCSLFWWSHWEYVNLIWVVHWLCAITWVMVFSWQHNRLHSALLLSERKMNLMSHWCYLIVSMMSAQIVFNQ
jgi:hypothetical protein